jgi:hypothetical protein
MARKPRKIWAPGPARPQAPNTAEKRAIISACEHFIATVLKPRFLPEIKPTQFNYPIDIHGEWRAGRYRFMKRYRSGFADNAGWEFDAPFARLSRMAPDRFDIHWMRHTGQWWPMYSGKTLEEALHLLETDGVLWPH